MQRQRPVSISNPNHFVNIARRAAAASPGALFADQFENMANYRAHLRTGQEIWQQTGGHLDAFICGSGESTNWHLHPDDVCTSHQIELTMSSAR